MTAHNFQLRLVGGHRPPLQRPDFDPYFIPPVVRSGSGTSNPKLENQILGLRRFRSKQERRAIVEETLKPGASVSVVTARMTSCLCGSRAINSSEPLPSKL